MAAIDQHVVVNITKATARLTRVGFGVPLILGVNNKFAERVREYSNITAVAVDFATTDEEFRIASLLFSQQLSPEKNQNSPQRSFCCSGSDRYCFSCCG